MFPFFKKKKLFNPLQEERIIAAIRAVEEHTSGEVRVFVENKNKLVDPLERAKQVFHQLQMDQSHLHNHVLIYIAIKHRELAIYAGEGIFKQTGEAHWKASVKEMIAHFKGGDIADSLVKCIHHVGQTLKEKFPKQVSGGQHDLPGGLVFGA